MRFHVIWCKISIGDQEIKRFWRIGLDVLGKFCPICKHKNERTALVCGYCGALLDEAFTSVAATTKNTGEPSNLPVENFGSYINVALIPEGGIGIYATGTEKPYYLHMDKGLVIGRKMEATSVSESFLDLSLLDGYNVGLSRRHAIIRRAESGFEVIDLSSTNGTWLNEERLIPNKPYPFASGAQLRLSRMRLFVVYQIVLKGTKKNKLTK